MATDISPKPPVGKTGLMAKKIGPLPLPVAALIVAAVAYLAYRHFHNASSSTANASSTPAATPSTDSGLGSVAGPPSTNGTGTGGAGAGMSVSDLEGLIAALQGSGGSNSYYYYGGAGSGSAVPGTLTESGPPGNGVGSQSAPASSSKPTGGGDTGAGSGGGSAGPSAAQIQQDIPDVVSGEYSPTVSNNFAPPSYVDTLAAAFNNYGDQMTNQFGGPSPNVNNPTVTANPTGASANKNQGIYSIH